MHRAMFITVTLALFGAAGCSERTEDRLQQAGHSTGEALESAAGDVQTGAEVAVRETGEAIDQIDQEVEQEAAEEHAEEQAEERAEVTYQTDPGT